MPIVPLPQFEADLAQLEAEDRAAYERLKPPDTVVVRFGSMKMIGEFPYSEDVKPGCGTKLVVRTHRGTEMGELLTSTCPNSGCSKSVSRKEMLEYIDRSGGRDFPFHTKGRVLRIANKEDLDRAAEQETAKQSMRLRAKAEAAKLGLTIRVVEVEPILSSDRVILHYTTPGDDAHGPRPDLRALTQTLTEAFETKVDTHGVGARDEARLVADYERCGQYCCCKNFLKVLKPVSMRSAKTQKATLDPLKISGRCGRLMCCLRYEDQTYTELRKRLPHRKSRVGTPDGDGIVIDTQILTQLVRVRLDSGRDIAVTVEELTEPVHAKAPPTPPPPTPPPPTPTSSARTKADRAKPDRNESGSGKRRKPKVKSKLGSESDAAAAPTKRKKKRRKKTGDRKPRTDETPVDRSVDKSGDKPGDRTADRSVDGDAPRKKKRRSRRRRKPPGSSGEGSPPPSDG
ncbi:MAG: regulatory iron-sulfur-containing complex subunit RicT [Planctomycetota bacterium]